MVCYRRPIIIVLIAIIAVGSLSCGKKSPLPKPTPTQTQKPPPELEKMKKDLGQLGTLLKKRRTAEIEISPQAHERERNNQEDTQNHSQKEDDGQKNQSGQFTTKEHEWREEMKTVRSLHRAWNGLEPEAVTKGMTSANQVALEKNLCDLTLAVESQRALEAQLAANQVYRYYIEAAALFKTGVPANLERIRYHVAETYLQGAKGSWTNAEEEALKSMEIWQQFSYSLDKIERQELYQMEHSLTDLYDVVSKHSIILTSIKSEIALQNLDQIERKIKGSVSRE